MSDYKHGDWYCKPASEAEAREIVERAVASGAELYDTTDLNSICGYKWNLCSAWGVYQGKTHTADVTFKDVKEYTIAQIRKLFPLPSEHNGKGLPVLYDLDTPLSGVYLTDVFTGNMEPVTLVCDHRAGVQGALRQCGQAMSRKTDFVSYWGDWVAHNQAGEKVAKWDGEGWPPVGIEVEVLHEGQWVGAATVGEFGRHKKCMVCAPNGGGFYGYYLDQIRPIRSKRDQWVTDTQTYFNENLGEVCPSEGVLLGIYDAIKSGDLKAPEVG